MEAIEAAASGPAAPRGPAREARSVLPGGESCVMKHLLLACDIFAKSKARKGFFLNRL